MAPTTLTPWSSRPSAVVSAVAPRTASNGQGSRGANRVPTNNVTMTARLMATVARIGGIDMLQGGDDLRDRLGPVDLHPEELAELAGHHDHGDASEVADEHGAS